MTVVAACVLYACANIGSPEGGPRDYTPPRVLRTSPAQGQTDVKGRRIEIAFDEIVNVKDQQKKVTVSPLQKQQPIIKSLGKKVVVELRDELLPDATYTIDFANAIEDNNEGNPMDGLAFSFATGSTLDTLQISGMVLRASDLEPMQWVLVGVHSNLDDTAFTRQPFERITRTDSRGRFTLRNLKPGSYRVYALADMDGDYHMSRTEDIAFLNEVIVPTVSTFESSDTIFTFDHRVDTVWAATHIDFLPNDVLLMMFNENYRSLYLKKTERPTPGRLHVLFSAPTDTLPRLRLLQPPVTGDDWYTLERGEAQDSLFYWITDPTLTKTDTLVVAMDYLRTGTDDSIAWTTDTLTFAYRKSGAQRKAEAEAQKERERRDKRIAQLEGKQKQGKTLSEDEEYELEELRRDSAEVKFLNVSILPQSVADVRDTLRITATEPIAQIDAGGVRVEVMVDSVWQPVAGAPALQRVKPWSVMDYMLPMQLKPGSAYRLVVDSLAITSITGLGCKPMTQEVKVRPLEYYANLKLTVTGASGAAFVQLLSGDKVVRQEPVVGGKVVFDNVSPGTYYARLVLDANDNGQWDTGNFLQHLQPEEVYYYPKPMRLRRNWDLDLSWNIYETALDLQKPDAIKRNKPEQNKNLKKKGDKQGDLDEDEEDDEFNTNGFNNNTYTGNRYRDYQNGNN